MLGETKAELAETQAELAEKDLALARLRERLRALGLDPDTQG